MQQQKKKRKEEAYHWRVGASSRHITNLKQSILETFDIYVSYFAELWFRQIFLANPFFPAGFTGQGVLKKNPTVWLDGARPPQIKSNYEFDKVIILQTWNFHVLVWLFFS